MLPKWHILIGFVFSYILVYFFNFSVFAGTIIFLWSFLIDVDHYFIYVIEGKFDLIKDYAYHKRRTIKYLSLKPKIRRQYKLNIILFHGIEFLVIMAILSLFFNFFLWILIGTLLHLIFDFFDLAYKKEPFYSKFSQIYTYTTNKNKKILK